MNARVCVPGCSVWICILRYNSQSTTLFSDHKPLIAAFYAKTPPKSDRQQRHLSLLSEYISTMQFIKGTQNITADCLSRPVCAITVDPFDLHGIARCQTEDAETETFKDRLTPIELSADVVLLCDTSTPSPRPFVPLSLRENVVASLHNISHTAVSYTHLTLPTKRIV